MKRYQLFLHAADLGSLSRAAEEMGYTQSGASHIVKGLESEFGFPLLHRHRRGVSPTEDGIRLVPAMRELVRWNERLEQIAASVRGMEIGTIHIGSITSISVHWIPRILKRFRVDHPGITVKLHEGGDHELIGWLGEGRLDFCFCCDQIRQPFEWIPLTGDELLAILPEDYPAEDDRFFPVAAFQDAPFVMLPSDYHYETQRLFEKYGIVPDVKFSATDDHTTVAMVEQGLGLSILSRLTMLEYPHRRVKILELRPEWPRTLGIALPSAKDLSPAAAKFIDCARRVVTP